MKYYSTKDAAVYLGLSVSSVKYHIYVAKDLAPDAIIGHAAMFTEDNLRAFQKRKRPAHRPQRSS